MLIVTIFIITLCKAKIKTVHNLKELLTYEVKKNNNKKNFQSTKTFKKIKQALGYELAEHCKN